MPQKTSSPLQTKFPPTRYMGSKQAILPHIWKAVEQLPFNTVLDAFSGSGCVGYMFKSKRKRVISNDFLRYSYTLAHALISNNHDRLSGADMSMLLKDNHGRQNFIQNTFAGLYFPDEDNLFLDNTVANIVLLDSPFKRSLAFAALSRACIKRRPRGIFTYVGDRYNDGRRDLKLSLKEQFINAVAVFNQAVFDNGRENVALNEDVFSLDIEPDLVYFDPPYYTAKSDNDYLRRYHFVEGLCRYWKDVEIQWHTKTRKLKKFPTPFDSKAGVYPAFERLFQKYSKSIIVVSYSSNGLPTKDDLYCLLEQVKNTVEVTEVSHRYSFGTHANKVGNENNVVKEYLFVAY